MDIETRENINAELRYLTLELMKIAATRNKPFSEIVDEYIENVIELERKIREKTL